MRALQKIQRFKRFKDQKIQIILHFYPYWGMKEKQSSLLFTLHTHLHSDNINFNSKKKGKKI